MSGGGGGHVTGAGARGFIRNNYPPGTLEKMQQSLADDLEERGILPETKKKCQCCIPVAFTILICAIIFMVIWELT